MGVPEFVKADMVKPGAVVIDVGVNRIPDPEAKNGSRLVGDVDFAAVQPVASRITPNPGGVGPKCANSGKDSTGWGVPEEITNRGVGMFHHILQKLQCPAVGNTGEACDMFMGWISTRTHRYYIDERGVAAQTLLAVLNSTPPAPMVVQHATLHP